MQADTDKHLPQVITIITLSCTFIGMAGSIMGQNLFFSSHETPLVRTSPSCCWLSYKLTRCSLLIACPSRDQCLLSRVQSCCCLCHHA